MGTLSETWAAFEVLKPEVHYSDDLADVNIHKITKL